jgi:hypothetical protein
MMPHHCTTQRHTHVPHISGLAFKASKTGAKTKINSTELSAARWMKVARGFQLKLTLKAGGGAAV